MANDLLKLKMFNPNAFNKKFGGIETFSDFGSDAAENLNTTPQLDIMGGIASGVGDAAGALSPQEELNRKFIDRNKNIGKEIESSRKLTDVTSSVASKFGPWGMVAAAGLQTGQKLIDSSTDEFGVVQDSTKAIIGGILNPVTGIKTLAGQKNRVESKDRFINTELSSKRAENQVAGNKITNSIPKYTPPSYGRLGRKLTKFTRWA